MTDHEPLVAPLDPGSEKGREVAARLSRTLADVEASIAARKARAKAADGHRQHAP